VCKTLAAPSTREDATQYDALEAIEMKTFGKEKLEGTRAEFTTTGGASAALDTAASGEPSSPARSPNRSRRCRTSAEAPIMAPRD